MHRHIQTKPKIMVTEVLSKPSAMLATNKVLCEEAGIKIGSDLMALCIGSCLGVRKLGSGLWILYDLFQSSAKKAPGR